MAFTTIPPAGSKLRGSVLSALITECRPVHARKTADETVSNSTTLQNDDALFVAVAANCTYELRLYVIYDAGTTADYKWALTYPAGSTLNYTVVTHAADLTFTEPGASAVASGTAVAAGGNGLGTPRGIHVLGNLVTSTTAGTLQYQWAQNGAVVENTLTKAGSQLVVARLA